MLNHPEWTNKVSGLLAVGAIAKGCKKAMEPELVELVPILITCLSDKKVFVRGFACVTLSGYADLVVIHQPQYLASLMTELLKRVLDENKHVQEAACSSLTAILVQLNPPTCFSCLGFNSTRYIIGRGRYTSCSLLGRYRRDACPCLRRVSSG